MSANVASTAQTIAVTTVLGPNGQATNNGVTLESLVANYQAYYVEGGGNLLISAGANIAGYLPTPANPATTGVPPMDEIGNWLWRQGEGAGASGTTTGASTAWWINFGTLALPLAPTGSPTQAGAVPTLTGFTGIGTLGGGNVTILAGGNIGATSETTSPGGAYSVNQAIDVAVGSTGRVSPGATGGSGIQQTGGGVLTIEAGGAINRGGTAPSRTSQMAP